jgi:feruloyl esterase
MITAKNIILKRKASSRSTKDHFKVSLTTVLLLIIFTSLGYAENKTDDSKIEAESRCKEIANLKLNSGSGMSYANILSAAVASLKIKNDDTELYYCRVHGYIRPAINFEIRLPLKHWNKKFYMVGCGGFCGNLYTDEPANVFSNNINFGLVRNYAVSTMDSGHWGESHSDGRWAYNNRVKEVDWAYRAVHETAKASKQVIESFYKKDIKRSYFQGCSTGGRMAIKEALMFGAEDDRIFDGIISGAPALNYTGLVGTIFAWITQANYTASGKEIITREDAGLIMEAVNEKCKNSDNMLIEDPQNCDFDPESLLCKDRKTDKCLSKIQVDTLKKFYQGPVNSKNKLLFKGLPKSSEPYWWFWVNSQIPVYSENFLKYMAFQFDPNYDYKPKDFNFDTDPSKLQFMGNIYNATDTNLDGFFLHKKKGKGKIIMWHGWADAMVTPWFTVEFYEQVSKNLKKKGENPMDYIRLFMIPGLDHCGALCQGSKVDKNAPAILDEKFDPLAALDKWFEKDQAPESLLIKYRKNDGTISSDYKEIPYYKKR